MNEMQLVQITIVFIGEFILSCCIHRNHLIIDHFCSNAFETFQQTIIVHLLASLTKDVLRNRDYFIPLGGPTAIQSIHLITRTLKKIFLAFCMLYKHWIIKNVIAVMLLLFIIITKIN
jgi:hypothetical protein